MALGWGSEGYGFKPHLELQAMVDPGSPKNFNYNSQPDLSMPIND